MKKRISSRLLLLVITSSLLLFNFSCNKQKKPAINSAPPLLAPCELAENQFFTGIEGDTMFYGNKCLISDTPNDPFENCHYYVRLKSTNSYERLHLYFTKEPQTGIYTTPHVDNVLENDTIIGMIHTFGASEYLRLLPYPSGDNVYVNNQNGKITISWCNLYFSWFGEGNNLGLTKCKITFKKN